MLLGGCLCGAIRFQVAGHVQMRGLCLCRTCQEVSGGAGNMFVGLMARDFEYVSGSPNVFAAEPGAPAREFCGVCGVHLAARSPKAPEGIIVKVGALDEPAVFAGPSFVVWTDEKEAFHQLPEGVPAFPKLPGR